MPFSFDYRNRFTFSVSIKTIKNAKILRGPNLVTFLLYHVLDVDDVVKKLQILHFPIINAFQFAGKIDADGDEFLLKMTVFFQISALVNGF